MDTLQEPLRYVLRTNDPKKCMYMPLQTHTMIRLFAQENGFSMVEAVIRLVQFGTQYWGENNKSDDIPVLTSRIDRVPKRLTPEH